MKTPLHKRSPVQPQALLQVRSAIAREFTDLSRQEPRLARLTLNEAEALAFQSGFPFLVFPVLAEEKFRVLSAWREYQDFVRREDAPRRRGARWRADACRFARNRGHLSPRTQPRSARLGGAATAQENGGW